MKSVYKVCVLIRVKWKSRGLNLAWSRQWQRIIIPNVLLPVTGAWITSADRGNPLRPIGKRKSVNSLTQRRVTSPGPCWIISIVEDHRWSTSFSLSFSYSLIVRLVDRTIERKNSSDETKIVKIGNWCKKCVRFYRMTFYRPLLFLPLPYRLFSSVENQWKAHAQPDESELNSQPRISSDLIVYIKLEASSSKNIRTILYRELDFTNSLNY